MGGSPFGGRRGDPGFHRVGGCAVRAFCPFAVATAASMLMSEDVAVRAVWRLADTAEATCSLVCDGVRFWVARSLTVAAVGALVLAAVAAIGAVRRLAVTAAAACLSVCAGVPLRWPARCTAPRWPRW